jgi:hypothetical protein
MGTIPNKITGGCHCGAIRYEASTPPVTGSLCHCRDCQRSSGSAFEALAMFPQSEFRIIRGEPRRYISKLIMEKYFCSNCGSQLTDRYLVPVSAELQPHMVWVHIGTLDNPEIATIEDHYGVESQLSWVHFDDGLPRVRCDEDPDLVAAFAAAQAGAG